MAEETPVPDFSQGVAANDLSDGGMIAGRVDGKDVVLACSGGEIFAIGAHCTHYKGPLADGLIVGDTVRCPWHHACFSLRTGEALRAPALDSIACWRVERLNDRLFVREPLQAARQAPAVRVRSRPASVVIVGGGAAGLSAAQTLRQEGYDGPVTMMSADDAPPSDRPNLSKDYLAGHAQDDWIPLREPEFYRDRRIDLLLGSRVSSIDVRARMVILGDGVRRSYGALLLATGADPIHLPIPGADSEAVHYLRTFSDSRTLVTKAQSARHVVVAGASFIGLEVAASLRARGIDVTVVAPEQAPLERVMGPEVGRFIQSLHEGQGVTFRLGQTVAGIDGRRVRLSGGDALDCDFVVMGVGVKPAIGLAEQAGLAIDHGVAVDEYLETSVPGIFAAGDIARWPDRRTGDRIRVEHWVVAERQGRAAAKNILGYREPYRDIPFFWSQHYDVAINYVGHAERWDRVDIDGDLNSRDCSITYKQGERRLAVATIGRDRDSLVVEAEMEREN